MYLMDQRPKRLQKVDQLNTHMYEIGWEIDWQTPVRVESKKKIMHESAAKKKKTFPTYRYRFQSHSMVCSHCVNLKTFRLCGINIFCVSSLTGKSETSSFRQVIVKILHSLQVILI